MPPDEILTKASSAVPKTPWVAHCEIFTPAWNAFVTEWAGKIKPFIEEVFGPYGTEPLPHILPLSVMAIGKVAPSASFDMDSGQIQLTSAMEGDAGRTLEKLTHEMLHGSFSLFPSDDEFYDEGFVDFSALLLSAAPIYGNLGPLMRRSAQQNLARRIKMGMAPNATRYDFRRASGAIHAKLTYGHGLIEHLRNQKLNQTFQWDPAR